MRAMVFHEAKTPLELEEVEKPIPKDGELLLKVLCCGVCRTDLHIYEGDVVPKKNPLILGHQIVGVVESKGKGTSSFEVGQRVGVPWLAKTCNHCHFCNSGRENLCNEALYTGHGVNGGYAEYCVVRQSYCFSIPDCYSEVLAAPLLCAGLIGYRSYKMAGSSQDIGFYGFGAAAHLLLQCAVYEKKSVYVFTRDGDEAGQQEAIALGAKWAGNSSDLPPKSLQASIIFAPAGELVPKALEGVEKGGKVICAGIHMSDIPSFPYSLLWGERSVCSVANLTRKDGKEFLELAPKIPIEPQVKTYPLEEANQALADLKEGNFSGSAVLLVSVRGSTPT